MRPQGSKTPKPPFLPNASQTGGAFRLFRPRSLLLVRFFQARRSGDRFFWFGRGRFGAAEKKLRQRRVFAILRLFLFRAPARRSPQASVVRAAARASRFAAGLGGRGRSRARNFTGRNPSPRDNLAFRAPSRANDGLSAREAKQLGSTTRGPWPAFRRRRFSGG